MAAVYRVDIFIDVIPKERQALMGELSSHLVFKMGWKFFTSTEVERNLHCALSLVHPYVWFAGTWIETRKFWVNLEVNIEMN